MKNEIKFLSLLLFIFLIIEMIIGFFYIDYPDVPHNFFTYTSGIDMVKKGTLYIENSPKYDMLFPYGSMTAITLTIWADIFDINYFSIKLLFILFGMITIIILYFIAKELTNTDSAKYIIILYAFSFITLWSVGAEADNNVLFLAFELVSMLFLFRKDLITSALFMGYALSFKIIPIFTLIPIIYYLYKEYTQKVKAIIGYLSIVTLIFLMPFLYFYTIAGSNALFPYMPQKYVGIDGLNILNLIKFLTYYFIFGSDKPFNTYNFPADISIITTIIGLTIFLLYIVKYNLKDRKIELIRNIILLNMVIMLFSTQFYWFYVQWILPFVLLIVAYYIKETENYDIYKISILWTIFGVILMSIFYREIWVYNTIELLIFIPFILFIFLGSIYTYKDSGIELEYSIIIFASLLSYLSPSKLLVIFGLTSRNAWGYEYFISIVLMIIGIILLFRKIHIIIKRGIINH